MNIFQIPKNEKTGIDKVIGVIDASGSMTENWPWLATNWNKYIPNNGAITITFDTIAREVPGNKLDNNINIHGGGGTNITKAFTLLEKKLEELPVSTAVTVIFISDGQDNNLGNLEFRFNALKGNQNKRRLNFLCLGVGKDFPTFISMRLREKYHNGDETIPAIFLIEYVTEKAYQIKFEAMQNFFSLNQKRQIQPPVCLFPWREFTNEVYEGLWVYTYDKVVNIDNIELRVEESYLDYKGINELFRSWSQMIHLESLKEGENVKIRALKTLEIMDDILTEVQQIKGVDLLKVVEAVNEEGIGFKERAFRNYLKREVGRISWFYNDVKLIAEGKAAKDLNEFEAAKRINLGAIVGNYNMKAQSVKQVTIEDYQKMKRDFIDIYRKTPLHSTSKQEASVISLLNQKDVFLEKDFLEGLDACKNQFDLVESFPIVGLALRITRNENSKINPWLTHVVFIARHNKTIDSSAMIRNFGTLTLKIGENDTETVNCVLPLFSPEDKDMIPLLKSQLFTYLMSVNVMSNQDLIQEDAYPGLLANTLFALLTEKKSEWQQSILKLIDYTIKMIEYDKLGFMEFHENLLDDPYGTFLNDSDQKNYSLPFDLSKTLMHLFCLHSDKCISNEQIAKIIELMYLVSFFQYFRENKDSISKFFKLEYLKLSSNSNAKEILKNKIRGCFPTCRTFGDFERAVLRCFAEVAQGVTAAPKWSLDHLKQISGKYSPEALDKISMYFLDAKLKEENMQKIILKAYCASDYKELLLSKSFNYNQAQQMLVNKMKEKINIPQVNPPPNSQVQNVQVKGKGKKVPKNLSKKPEADLNKFSGSSEVRDLIALLKPEFIKFFGEIHKFMLPISKKDLQDYCTANHKKTTEYIIGRNGLITNACTARNCKFYLKTNGRLSHHLAIWSSKLPPAFHKTVLSKKMLPVDEIYEHFIRGDCNSGNVPVNLSAYDATETYVKEYIRLLKNAYTKTE